MLHANQSLKTWGKLKQESSHVYSLIFLIYSSYFCLLYTSDAADDG